MTIAAPSPVVMIGLDAADLALLRGWMTEGRLPALQQLRERGHLAELASPADAFAGGVWPSFYSGRSVPAHGIYHNKLWRARAMRLEVPTDAWLGARPFHERASVQGKRVCIVDLPMVLGRPRPVNGLYVGGWATHDLTARGSWPNGIWREIEQRHGRPSMPAEQFGRQDPGGLLRLRDQLLRATDQMRVIALDLLARERWDFACIVLGALHRGGHYLFDLSQLDAASLRPSVRAELEGALLTLYQAVDRAVGDICAQLDPTTLVIAFALHGMAPNPGWADLFADIMASARRAGSGTATSTGLLYTLKRKVPFHWVRPLLTQLPPEVTDRLVVLWSRRMFDWSRTADFPVPMDHAGYVRINVVGRERDGVVAEGAAYDRLCDELTELIGSLRDAATGRVLAAEVARPWRDAAGAYERDLLPDLLVTWAEPRAGEVRKVVSSTLPGWHYDVPPHLPSGRSGNHSGRGWMIAVGPGVDASTHSSGHDILDMAPTVAARLGLTPDPAWEGRPIPLATPS
jgi:predicted AlkP superfamily phosphohydrolase/phosphomutase